MIRTILIYTVVSEKPPFEYVNDMTTEMIYRVYWQAHYCYNIMPFLASHSSVSLAG